MGHIIDGKMVAESMKAAIGEEVKELVASGKRAPHLVAILVGNNGASETYVANKVKSCEELGFSSTLLR
ncbi:MAG: Methylenetetrahydrofolate dehydrogenase, partial [Bacteroidota bacterium]